MRIYRLIILVLLLLIVIFILAVLYFWKFAVVRTKKKELSANHKETEFDRLYKARIKSGIQWFKERSPERLYIMSHDGLKLAADYLPAENAKGTIIVVHGYRSSNVRDFSCVFEVYHNWGYNILAVHDRAHGESEGKYIGFGILDRYDVYEWVKYVVENIGGKIVLDGMSMGASTVLMTSGFTLPDNVKCIIADCGFTSPWEECKHVLKRSFNLPAFPLLPACSFAVKLTAKYGLRDYSTLDAMKVNKIPILFIHGGSDSFVPTYMSKQNYDACIAEKKLIVVDGAEHGESYLKDQANCTVELKNFLDKYIDNK